MAVDWTKPIEAYNTKTEQVIPLTFDRFDESDGQPIATPNPGSPDEDDTFCLFMDGTDWFGGPWIARNVAAQGRTFAIDHRDNTELHKLYVGWAIDILETVSDTIARLDDFSNWNASQFATELRKTRAKLVKEDAAFFEAAAISYAGRAWLDAVEES